MLAICGGLMRTGSVAMFQIMREIVEHNHSGYAPVLPVNHEMAFIEKNIDYWANDEGIIVLKLHRWIEDLEPYKDKLKVVMTIRDMRDVVVSLMNFRGGGFEPAINSNAFKGNIEGQAEWEQLVPPQSLFIVKYENFIHQRALVTSAVADHIGSPVNAVDAHKIEMKWNINANLRRAKAKYPTRSPEFMSERHINSGQTGQWKEALTTEQIQEIQDRAGSEWFNSNGYRLV